MASVKSVKKCRCRFLLTAQSARAASASFSEVVQLRGLGKVATGTAVNRKTVRAKLEQSIPNRKSLPTPLPIVPLQSIQAINPQLSTLNQFAPTRRAFKIPANKPIAK
jgi:hypothetical protein